jgi:predicted ATP-binding protein involved in virulence
MQPYFGNLSSLIYEMCLDYMESRSFDRPLFRFLSDVFSRLSADHFELTSIKRSGRTTFEIEALTEGSSTPIPLRYASQGTMSVLAIFGAIRSYLKALHPTEHDELAISMPGIVIIDEIDAHLHPSWQQRLTNLLRDVFPHVQFFVSAHSPLVAAGCLANEVAVLRKTPNSKFSVEQFERDFIGASARELYARLFEIEELDESLRRYPSWKPMHEAKLNRLRELDKVAETDKLSANERLERARLLREDRTKRRAAQVVEAREDETLRTLRLQAEIERLRDEVADLRRNSASKKGPDR